MNQTFITLTKTLLLEKEGKSPISNFFLEKRSKKSANPLYLLGFTGIPTIHKSALTLRNFLLRKNHLQLFLVAPSIRKS
jgi:hypothetical protein